MSAGRCRWLVTGAAGFIGSHLVEALLNLGQEVRGLDNFRTGRRENLEDVRARVTPEQWSRLHWIDADITHPDAVRNAVEGVDFVLHQAAVGSVPFSIQEPRLTHEINVSGTLNVFDAARLAGVRRVVYASSSAVYGDCPDCPAREERVGRPLSPYAATKAMNEAYADVFGRCYGQSCVGLRYFNVFGRRQDPAGAYAAVIPRWIDGLARGQEIVLYGDGTTTRDFCPVGSVVEANLRAALADLPEESPRVFNVGLGLATSLNRLLELIQAALRVGRSTESPSPRIRREEFRTGDVRHSRADLSSIRRWLGYEAPSALDDFIGETAAWFAGAPSSRRPGLA